METSSEPTTSSSSKYQFRVERSWGVGSLRQCAGFPGGVLGNNQSHTYVTPLGPQIVVWDISTHEKKLCFQAHSDLVICLLYNKQRKVILSISYGGEIKLWNQHWKLLAYKNTTFGCAHFGAWSNDSGRFLICGGEESLVAVYQLKVNDSNKGLDFELLWIQKGVSSQEKQMATTEYSSLNAESASTYESSKEPTTDAETSNSVTYVKQKDWYDIAMFNSQNHIIALLQRFHNHLSEAHLYNESGELVKTRPLDPIGDPKAAIMCTTTCCNSIFAVGFQGGIFVILDEEDLSTRSILQATGSPQVAIWDGEYILAVSYLSGIISWWTINGELVHEVKGAPHDSIVHLNWSTDENQRGLWVGGIMSLSYITLRYTNAEDKFPCKLTEQFKLKYHSVTGCGVNINKDGLIASGDLTGNIFIWTKGVEEPIHKLNHDAAVRCLAWNGQTLFIGSLDGMILKWCPGSSGMHIALVCTGGVLSMRWSNHDLAIGLDNGDLLVYRFINEALDDSVELLNFRAHSMMREGSVVSAEVWSVCWSPCCTMIATASEDRSTCIWSVATGEKLQTLHGHTTAVTSVDWKLMSNQQNILATCADDRTVHVIDGSSYDIIHILKLQNILGWYTLTYLSLDPTCQQCLCSTQNGRVVLWDCISGELLACRKVHCGSIEGLVYNAEYSEFATVSSDCVVNVFSIHL